MSTSLSRVVLAGRTNVGKSTLFNRLSGTAQSIISPIPGTTRDLNMAVITWRGTSFQLIDSGGLDAGMIGPVEEQVQAKAVTAMTEADLVVMVTDSQTGVSPTDRRIARNLKKSGRPALLAGNKADNPRLRQRAAPELYALGLGEPLLVSGLNGTGTGDLLDAIVGKLHHIPHEETATYVHVSIIGKTNVGKSSLVNAVLGQDWAITSSLPHTTREPRDTNFVFNGRCITLVDTAGLRKHENKAGLIEKISAAKTQQAIRRSDISLFVTDATTPLSNQDLAIAQLALASRNGIIIVVNKWDAIPDKTPQTMDLFITRYQRYFPWLSWAPIIFVSAEKKQRLPELLDLVLSVQAARLQHIPTENLQRVISHIRLPQGRVSNHPATKLINLVQTGNRPPTFTLTTNRRGPLNAAVINLVEKQIRADYDFNGTPIDINVEKRK